MTSIHCAPLLAAILLLIPAALAQSVPTGSVGQAILDQPLLTDVALPSLGGQLTNGVDMAFAVSTDKYPNTVNTGAVTFGFTVATSVPVGGQVTVTVPKGYFTNVDSSKVNTFTGTSATCRCVGTVSATNSVMTCTVAQAALAVGAATLSMAAGALTTGEPQAASNYNVQTTTDRALTVAPATQQIGGIIYGVGTLTFATATAAADKTPGATNTGDVSLAFSVATPIPVGGTLTLSFPKNYLSAVSSSVVNKFAGKTTVTCVLTKATKSTDTVDTVVCTTAVSVLEATTQTLTFIAGAITVGGPVAAVTGSTTAGIKVSSSSDRQSLSGGSTVRLGNILTQALVATSAAALPPNTANTAKLDIGFTPVTALPIGGRITLAVTPKYFTAVDSSKTLKFYALTGDADSAAIAGPQATCQFLAGTKGTAVFGINDADTIVCTTSGAELTATAKILRFSPASVTAGQPQAAGFFNLATNLDENMAAVTTGNLPLIGALQTETLVATSAAALPASTANTAKLDIGFKPITALPIGGKITLAVTPKYFTAVDSSKTLKFYALTGDADSAAIAGPQATCQFLAGTKGTAVFGINDADTIVCTTSGAELSTGAKILRFSPASVTAGQPQVAGFFNLATSMDFAMAAVTTGNLPVIGAAVSSVSLPSVTMVPGTANTAVITFKFTTATDIPSGGKITVSLPRNYFTRVDESKTQSPPCTCALNQATGIDTQDTIVCTTTAAITAGADKLLEFAVGSVTIGGATAAASTGLTVSTSVDRAPTGVTTLSLGSTLEAGTALVITNADDRVPGKFSSNNNTITFGFSVITSIPIGGQITITLPQGYFSKVDSTKENTIGTTATAKCALANAQRSVPAAIETSVTTVSTAATLTVKIIPAVVTGVTQVAIPLSGFSLDASSVASCTTNCASGSTVTAALANGVLTLTLSATSAIALKNTLTTFTVTLVTTPTALGWTTAGITGTTFNPTTTVVCTTAGAIIAGTSSPGTAHTFTFVAGSVTIGSGQRASTFQVESSTDLPLASKPATLSLGGGLTVGKPLTFANAQDQIPGRVNSGPISLGVTLSNSVPIGGQFLLTFPSNYFTNVNSASVVTLTKGTRRSLLQTSTLSCVRTAGTPNDQIICTLAGASSGTGAVVLTFPAGSLTTGLPTSTTGGYNIATANPPAASTARVPYFPKAASSAYGVAWLLVALSALLACF
jgi:hypothetical protein